VKTSFLARPGLKVQSPEVDGEVCRFHVEGHVTYHVLCAVITVDTSLNKKRYPKLSNSGLVDPDFRIQDRGYRIQDLKYLWQLCASPADMTSRVFRAETLPSNLRIMIRHAGIWARCLGVLPGSIYARSILPWEICYRSKLTNIGKI
jgi:hypothetical protein